MRHTAKILGLACAAALLAACGDGKGTSMKGEVMEKVQSPDGLVAATSTRVAGDEKTPARYHVYVEKSRDPAQAVEVLEADRSDPPRLRWLGPGGLEISMDCGLIHRFSNHANVWSAGETEEKSDQVVVLLDNRGVCPTGGTPPANTPPAN